MNILLRVKVVNLSATAMLPSFATAEHGAIPMTEP
jgi:hypothetical protein